MSSILTFEASVDGCAAEFCLNDIPLVRLRAPETRRAVIPVNELVVGGDNLVEIVVEPGPTPSAARRGDRRGSDQGMFASAQIVRRVVGTLPGDTPGIRLASLEFRGDGTERRFPAVLSRLADFGAGAGPWSWEKAERLLLDAATTAEVRRMIEQMKSIYRARDFDRLIRVKRFELSEWAQAYGEDEAAYAAQMRSILDEEFWGEASWSIADVDPAEHDLRLCAQGRLVECVARDCLPIIRTSDGQARFGMRLGRVQGTWYQLR